MLVKLGGTYFNPGHIDVMEPDYKDGCAVLHINGTRVYLNPAERDALVAWLHRLDGTPGHALVIDLTPERTEP